MNTYGIFIYVDHPQLANNKVATIKLVRMLSGCGLVEAKKIVDNWQATLPTGVGKGMYMGPIVIVNGPEGKTWLRGLVKEMPWKLLPHDLVHKIMPAFIEVRQVHQETSNG